MGYKLIIGIQIAVLEIMLIYISGFDCLSPKCKTGCGNGRILLWYDKLRVELINIIFWLITGLVPNLFLKLYFCPQFFF